MRWLSHLCALTCIVTGQSQSGYCPDPSNQAEVKDSCKYTSEKFPGPICRVNIVINPTDGNDWYKTFVCHFRQLENCVILEVLLSNINRFVNFNVNNLKDNNNLLTNNNDDKKEDEIKKCQKHLNKMFVLPDRFARYDNSDSPWGRMPDHGSENMEELKRHKVLSFTQKLREITGYIQMVDIKYDNDDEKLDELDFQLESLGQLFPSLQIRGNEPDNIGGNAVWLEQTDFRGLRLSQLTAVVHGGIFLLENMDLCVYNRDSMEHIVLDGAIEARGNNDPNDCHNDIENDDYCSETPDLKLQFENSGDSFNFTDIERFCYDSDVPGIPVCWEPGITLKDGGKTIPYPGQSVYCQINVKKNELENHCSNLCIGGCGHSMQNRRINDTIIDHFGFTTERFEFHEQMSTSTNTRGPLISTDCSGCNWPDAVLYLPTPDDPTRSRSFDFSEEYNGICYSRQLHGTYCRVKDRWSPSTIGPGGIGRVSERNNALRCEEDNDSNVSTIQFYNGCPDTAPWRAGDIRERLTSAQLLPIDQNEQKFIQGWYCASKIQCLNQYGVKSVMFHCDDDSCQSGACFGPKSGFGENHDALRCHQTHSSPNDKTSGERIELCDGSANLDGSAKCDGSISGPDADSLSQQQCRLGFTKKETRKADGAETDDGTYCIPCPNSKPCRRRCDFCQTLKISDASSLLNVIGCTEIRTAGGIEISEISDPNFHEHLAHAFRYVETVDCLTVSKSSSLADFMFLGKLKTITGRTWKMDRVDGKAKTETVSSISCQEKLSIKNNPNLQNLFGNIWQNPSDKRSDSTDSRLDLMRSARTVIKIEVPNPSPDWFNSLQQDDFHVYSTTSTPTGTAPTATSNWTGSSINQNGKLCPIEYFDLIRYDRNATVDMAIANYERDNPRADKVLLLFLINDSELQRLMRKFIKRPKVNGVANDHFTVEQRNKAYFFLRRWLHDQLIEQDKNGDSALTCIYFDVTNFKVMQPEDDANKDNTFNKLKSISVEFDDFFHNKVAKSILGLTIEEAAQFNKQSFINLGSSPAFINRLADDSRAKDFPIWRFTRDAIESYALYLIEDPDGSIEKAGQRYSENPCIKKGRSGLKWTKEDLQPKENREIECHTGNWTGCDTTEEEQCNFREECSQIKGDGITVKSSNTNYAMYVEIQINLRKDTEVNSNQRFTVRSPHKRIRTASSPANSVELKPVSNQVDPDDLTTTTSVTINWEPPKVPTGDLSKFVILYRPSVNKADGGKCEEKKYQEIIAQLIAEEKSDEDEPPIPVIRDKAKLNRYFSDLYEKCSAEDVEIIRSSNMVYPHPSQSCNDNKATESELFKLRDQRRHGLRTLDKYNEYYCPYAPDRRTVSDRCDRDKSPSIMDQDNEGTSPRSSLPEDNTIFETDNTGPGYETENEGTEDLWGMALWGTDYDDGPDDDISDDDLSNSTSSSSELDTLDGSKAICKLVQIVCDVPLKYKPAKGKPEKCTKHFPAYSIKKTEELGEHCKLPTRSARLTDLDLRLAVEKIQNSTTKPESVYDAPVPVLTTPTTTTTMNTTVTIDARKKRSFEDGTEEEEFSLTSKTLTTLNEAYTKIIPVDVDPTSPKRRFSETLSDLPTGKSIRLDIYACNKDIECGFGDLAEKFTKQLTSDQFDRNRFYDALPTDVRWQNGDWLSRSGAVKNFITPPYNSNDALRHRPFCLSTVKTKEQKAICELTSRQPLELIFQSPDWQKQNGFILFYEFLFLRDGTERKTYQNLSVSEEFVKEDFGKWWTNSNSNGVKSAELKNFCDYISKQSDLHVSCHRQDSVDKNATQTGFDFHRKRIQRDIDGTSPCVIKNDKDHCGFRMLRVDGAQMQDLFDGTGEYHYDVRVYTSGMLLAYGKEKNMEAYRNRVYTSNYEGKYKLKVGTNSSVVYAVATGGL